MANELDRGDERHLALLAYHLGHAAARLPSAAALQWTLADPGDSFPVPVSVAFEQVERCLAELASWPGFERRRSLKQAATAVLRVLGPIRAELSGSWASPAHADYIRFRQMAEQELDTAALMAEAPPLPSVAVERWLELMGAVRECWLELPTEVGRWAELGAAVASVTHPDGGDDQELARQRLPLTHSALARSPLLAGVRLDMGNRAHLKTLTAGGESAYRPSFTEWLAGTADDYHAAVLDRLTNPPGACLAPAEEQQKQQAPSKKMIALALLAEHPEWSDSRIARVVGCARTSLYRWPEFEALRDPSGQRDLRRGYVKGRGGEARLEAVDD